MPKTAPNLNGPVGLDHHQSVLCISALAINKKSNFKLQTSIFILRGAFQSCLTPLPFRFLSA